MAFEALNNAGVCDCKLLVILNDNDMSISPPVGALNRYLAQLMSGQLLRRRQERRQDVLRGAPPLFELAKRFEEHAKGMVVPATMFEKFGFNYVGPIDGHDLDSLIPTLENIKQLERPAVPARGDQEGPGLQAGRGRSGGLSRARQVRSGGGPGQARDARRSRPSRRCSATGCATWRRRTPRWSASRRRCAKARAWWSSSSAFPTATSTSASPSSMR